MSELGSPARPRRPSRFDVIVAAFFTTVVVVESFTEVTVMSQVVHAAVAATAMVTMTWRRIYPVAVALAVAVSFVVLAVNGGGLSIALGLLIVSFTLGSEASWRRSVIGVGLLALVGFSGLIVDPGDPLVGDLAAVATLIVGPWAAGRTLRQRAEQTAEALSRANRSELERRLDVERAMASERVRLARELHDIVSHSISVIVIQAQAVRRRLQPDQQREIADLAALETTAREAMVEMRRLFGVLRDVDGQPALSPQPGLRDLPRLVESTRAGDVEVRLLTSGDDRDLPPGLDLTAYRIAQEALTNALRHAHASEIVVRVDHLPAAVAVSVEDDGSGPPLASNGDRAEGNGLTGMRERAGLYGGTFEMAPRAPRGTRVRAVLPVGAER